jgi:hypothetical protein
LIVTEGVKKALAATQYGFPCVSVLGTENWSVKRPKRNNKPFGPRILIPDLEMTSWAGLRALPFPLSLAEQERIVLEVEARLREYHPGRSAPGS